MCGLILWVLAITVANAVHFKLRFLDVFRPGGPFW